MYFITQAENHELPGVIKLVYKPDDPPSTNCHPYTSAFESAVRTGLAVAQVCRQTR